MKYSLIVFIFLCISNLQGQSSDTIPFNLTTYNNILVDAIFNGEDSISLMFHTAAESIGLTPEATTRLRGKLDQTVTEGKAWGGTSEASYVIGKSLAIEKFSWDSLTVWTNSRSGHLSDGKFGPNLFDGKYIEINYDIEALVVHTSLPTLEGFKKYQMEMEPGSMYLSGSCFNSEDAHSNRFLIHSGYSGTILLDDAFASKANMNRLEIISESELSDSYGNVLKKKKATLPRFELEDFVFEDLPMGFFEGKIGNQKKSVIGGEMLKRFNIVLDRERGNIYLKPSKHYVTTVRDI